MPLLLPRFIVGGAEIRADVSVPVFTRFTRFRQGDRSLQRLKRRRAAEWPHYEECRGAIPFMTFS